MTKLLRPKVLILLVLGLFASFVLFGFPPFDLWFDFTYYTYPSDEIRALSKKIGQDLEQRAIEVYKTKKPYKFYPGDYVEGVHTVCQFSPAGYLSKPIEENLHFDFWQYAAWSNYINPNYYALVLIGNKTVPFRFNNNTLVILSKPGSCIKVDSSFPIYIIPTVNGIDFGNSSLVLSENPIELYYKER